MAASTIVVDVAVKPFTARLKRPFITSLGSKDSSCNVGMTVTLRGGGRGYGEASSSLALAHLTPASLARTMTRLGRSCLGRDAQGVRGIAARAWKEHAESPPAVSAFETALLGALLAQERLTLASWLGGALDRVTTDVTISAWDPGTAAEAAAEAAEDGFRTLKIKVGPDHRENLARMRSALARMPGRGRRVILDGNQGLTTRSSLALIESCVREGAVVELLEQPLPKDDAAGMRELTRCSPVPVAADEMVMSPEDAVRIADRRLASAINIKLAKSGIFRALEIAAVARAAGLGLMIGCMAESGEGLTPSVGLALGTGFFRWVDLDSDYLHRDARPPKLWKRDGPLLKSARGRDTVRGKSA
ncbi:MAG: dipeptide epimerase [Elusimicrobia bacterium]|nr:dipeptide epimerase [Elusimicrobiota bacterium]